MGNWQICAPSCCPMSSLLHHWHRGSEWNRWDRAERLLVNNIHSTKSNLRVRHTEYGWTIPCRCKLNHPWWRKEHMIPSSYDSYRAEVKRSASMKFGLWVWVSYFISEIPMLFRLWLVLVERVGWKPTRKYSLCHWRPSQQKYASEKFILPSLYVGCFAAHMATQSGESSLAVVLLNLVMMEA